MIEEHWRETMAESTKLDMALARFEDAVAQLDAVLRARRSRSEAAGSADGDGAGRNDDAGEQEHLRRELEELRARNADLEETNVRAVRKVDEAMTRIRTLLGGS